MLQNFPNHGTIAINCSTMLTQDCTFQWPEMPIPNIIVSWHDGVDKALLPSKPQCGPCLVLFPGLVGLLRFLFDCLLEEYVAMWGVGFSKQLVKLGPVVFMSSP